MKKTFQTPKFEIEFFAVQDVITASDDNMGAGGNPSPFDPVTVNSVAETFSIID